jgi:hypothetical protein
MMIFSGSCRHDDLQRLCRHDDLQRLCRHDDLQRLCRHDERKGSAFPNGNQKPLGGYASGGS